jgi:hypothetical protein
LSAPVHKFGRSFPGCTPSVGWIQRQPEARGINSRREEQDYH